MSENRWQQIQALYEAGLEMDEEERVSLLRKDGCNDAEIEAEVRELWENSDEDDPIFAFEALPGMSMELLAKGKGDPDRVNTYNIQEVIARGGMGTVYKAEQQQPIQRLVALKILPAEMHSQELFQRFQAEQRALALLAHNNVAAAYDAGVTAEGLPFFTMEYVEGSPITNYCDEHKLGIRPRLDLFIQVCEGVQHAHQKGVIHRDLKPSNIMVAVQNGRPVPKIIDFGIAKLVDQAQLAQTTRTRMGSVMGTPGYMSPEQAAGQNDDVVDTRTDIYSLGVLLYELLTGSMPLDRPLAKASSFREQCRIILEEDPPRPSTRIDWEQPDSRQVAGNRGAQPASLRKEVSRELDWITMKALAKEPAERYGSCAELSADVRRYLEGMPVLAGPPGNLYPIKKFIARHKGPVALAGGLAFSLILGLTLTLILLYRANAAEAETLATLDKLRAVNEFTVGMLESPNPLREGREVKVVDVLEKASGDLAEKFREQPGQEMATRITLGRSFQNLGLLPEARQEFQRALDLGLARLGPDHEDTLEAMNSLAFVLDQMEEFREAESLFRAAWERSAALYGEQDTRSLRSASGLAATLHSMGRVESSLNLFDKTIPAQTALLKSDHEQVLATQNNFALLLLKLGRSSEAEALFRKLLATYKEKRGDKHPYTLRVMHNLAHTLEETGQYEAAEELYRPTFAFREEILGPDHPETIKTLTNLATTIGHQGRNQEAIALLETVLELNTTRKDAQPNRVVAMQNLGDQLMKVGMLERADQVLQQTLQNKLRIFDEHDDSVLVTRCTIAENWQKMGKLADAEALFRKVVDVAIEGLGAKHARTALFKGLLGNCLAARGKYEEAEVLLLESERILTEKKSSYLGIIQGFIQKLPARNP